MEKNWKSAPWTVRVLFVYWVFPLLSTGLVFTFLAVEMLGPDPIGIWSIPLDLARAQYDEMPISTSLEIGISIMYCSAAYYAWRLLRGSGNSRIILEMFSWISIVFTSVNIFFPGIRYFEMDNLSPSFSDTPGSFLAVAFVLLFLQLAALYFLRTEKVKSYASIF